MTKTFMLRLMAGSACAVIASAATAQPATNSPQPEINASPASPSNEPAQPGAPAAQSTEQGLKEIVVTANRTQSSAQKTPIALTVYSGDDLAAAGVTNVVNLQQVDPSINVTTSTGAGYVAIRGVASTDVTEIGDPSVPIARDDFFTNRSFSIATSMYDLERVEVLKGPQGTLFGRNSTGGLIRLISRRPGKTFGTNGSVEVGNYNTLNAEAGIDLPVSDALQFRFAGIRHYHKGYRKLDVIGGRGDDDDTWSGRATMAFQPFAGLRGYVQYQHDDIDDVGDVALKTPLGVRPDGLSEKRFANYTRSYNKLKGDRVRWEVSYDQLPGGLSLIYAGGWDKQKWRHQLDGTTVGPAGTPLLPPPFFTTGLANFQQAENPTTWNHEVRLATQQDGVFTAQVGYFHFDEHNRNLASGLINRNPGEYLDQYGIRFNYDVKTKSDAVFGQVGFRPTDTVRITGGARYTWDSKLRVGQSVLSFGPLLNVPSFLIPVFHLPPVPLTITTPAGGERYKGKKPTFHLGADFTPTPRNMIYAKFDTGYKSGGFNSNGSAPAVQYGPENLKAFELGTKNRFADNHIQLNGDVFYQKYSGYQASQSSDALGGSTGTFNVGSADIYGLEAQFVASYGPLRVDANTTLLSTKLKNTAPLTRGDGSSADVNGNRLPNAPGFVLTGGIEYAIDAGALTVTPRVDGKHSSRFNYSVFNDADTEQHAYTTLNASVNIVPKNSPFEVLLFVRNLTDKAVFANAARNYVGDPDIDTFEYQPPRTYGVRFSAKFR